MFELPRDLGATLGRLEAAADALGPITPDTRDKVESMGRAAVALRDASAQWALLGERAKDAERRLAAIGDPRALFVGVAPAGIEEVRALAWVLCQIEHAEHVAAFWEGALELLREVLGHGR